MSDFISRLEAQALAKARRVSKGWQLIVRRELVMAEAYDEPQPIVRDHRFEPPAPMGVEGEAWPTFLSLSKGER